MAIRTCSPLVSTIRSTVLDLSARTGSLVALVIAAILIGMSTAASEAALRDVNPLTLAFVRFVVAATALLAVCRYFGMRPVFGRIPAILGLSGVTLTFTCQNIGLQHTSAMNATLMIEGSLPIVTAMLGALVLRERLSPTRIAGLLLAVSGVAVVVLQGRGGNDATFSLVGGLLTLLAGIWLAIYTVTGRRAFAGALSLPVLTGSVIIGAAALVPGAVYEGATDGPGRFTVPAIGWVLLLGLGGSAIAHVLWGHGLANLEATEVGIIGTVMPVAGVGLAALILGESITIIQGGGALLVAAGLGVTTIPIGQSLRAWSVQFERWQSARSGLRTDSETRRGRAKQAS